MSRANFLIRRETENWKAIEKKDSLQKAVQSAMPTIFTSGLILVVCGFVIGIISSRSSISIMGLLIGIGGICSIGTILFFTICIIPIRQISPKVDDAYKR